MGPKQNKEKKKQDERGVMTPNKAGGIASGVIILAIILSFGIVYGTRNSGGTTGGGGGVGPGPTVPPPTFTPTPTPTPSTSPTPPPTIPPGALIYGRSYKFKNKLLANSIPAFVIRNGSGRREASMLFTNLQIDAGLVIMTNLNDPSDLGAIKTGDIVRMRLFNAPAADTKMLRRQEISPGDGRVVIFDDQNVTGEPRVAFQIWGPTNKNTGEFLIQDNELRFTRITVGDGNQPTDDWLYAIPCGHDGGWNCYTADGGVLTGRVPKFFNYTTSGGSDEFKFKFSAV